MWLRGCLVIILYGTLNTSHSSLLLTFIAPLFLHLKVTEAQLVLAWTTFEPFPQILRIHVVNHRHSPFVVLMTALLHLIRTATQHSDVRILTGDKSARISRFLRGYPRIATLWIFSLRFAFVLWMWSLVAWRIIAFWLRKGAISRLSVWRLLTSQLI